ncbi:S8 family serine peptidase [Candidatus Pacearchaeota archaeon]|nr:S8 family serine peptidase [Candidatus Pacearchaeota archaeon]
MKKKSIIVVFSIILIIFTVFQYVSANGYKDNTYIPNSIYCSDTDRGVYSTIKGTISVGGKNYIDSCYNNNKTVYEYYCSGNSYGTSYINCPLGFSCSNGVCVSTTNAEKLSISIATLKDTYKVGEAIELTDPPYDVEPSVIGDIASSNTDITEINVNNGDKIGSIIDNGRDLRYIMSDGFIKDRTIDEKGNFISVEDAELLKPNGYIIEFTEEPMIKQYTKAKEKYKIKLKKDELEKKKVLKKASDIQKVKVNKEHVKIRAVIEAELGGVFSDSTSTSGSKINAKVIDESENNFWLTKLWNSIIALFSKKQITGEAIVTKTSPTTTASTSQKKEIKVLGEWDSVFNGIALNITAEEAEKLKKVSGVKAVHPNLKVKTLLQDSVPLISADKVWQRDGTIAVPKEVFQTIFISDKAVSISLENQVYTVKIERVTTTRIATLLINNERKSMKKGESFKLSQATLYVEDVQYDKYKEAGIIFDDSIVSIRLISDKSSVLGYTGKGVTIAIIDTGVDYTHPDFGSCTKEDFLAKKCSKVVDGYDFSDTIDINQDNDILDCFIEDKKGEYCERIFLRDKNNDDDFDDCYIESSKGNICEEDKDPMDYQGHGTHVAGIAAGKGDYNNNNIYEPEKGEVWGIAPDAQIYTYKVFPNSYTDVIIKAIERAVDPNQDGDFSDHLDIISMSLGGPGNPDDPMSKAVDNTVDAGVVVVIAAGNDGPGEQTISSPGTSRKAITVGATYKKDYSGEYWGDTDPKKDQIISFSSRGPVVWRYKEGNEKGLIKPDVVAPGALICAARHDSIFEEGEHPFYKPCIDDKHVQLAGTSMATPHVAGAVALIKQVHPDWSPNYIKAALKNTAVDLELSPIKQGAGKIDIKKTINLNEKPLIAELVKGDYEVTGIIDITGNIQGNNFDRYNVYYSKVDENNWKLICSGIKEVSNNILCKNFV